MDLTIRHIELFQGKSMRARPLAVLLASVGAAAFAGAFIMAYLAYPGRPSISRVMRFEGYIELPKGGRQLNILDYLTFSPDGLFVANISTGAVIKVEIDPQHLENSVVRMSAEVGQAHRIVILPGGDAVAVSRGDAMAVDVLNPHTLAVLAHIPVATDADDLRSIEQPKMLYLSHGDARLATLIDPVRFVTMGTIQLPGEPETAVYDGELHRVLQNLDHPDQIVAIDLDTKTIAGSWSLSPCRTPKGMALDLVQQRLFIACSGNNRLAVFDAMNHRLLASFPTGDNPDAVAYDPDLQRIYVASRGGWMTVIAHEPHGDRYTLLDQVKTHYGAHTLAIEPGTHRVFVAYASLFAHPRLAVFSPVLPLF